MVDLYESDKFYHTLQQLFQKSDPPTALFVHDDYQAAQIIAFLQRLGLRVPDDVSIIAPGDTLDFNLAFTPQITTMRINTPRMGKLAGEMMLERLANPDEEAHVLKVTQRLIERGTCKALGVD